MNRYYVEELIRQLGIKHIVNYAIRFMDTESAEVLYYKHFNNKHVKQNITELENIVIMGTLTGEINNWSDE